MGEYSEWTYEGGTKAFVSSGRRVPYPLSERLICKYKKRAVGLSGNLGGTAGFKVLSHIWDKTFFICLLRRKECNIILDDGDGDF